MSRCSSPGSSINYNETRSRFDYPSRSSGFSGTPSNIHTPSGYNDWQYFGQSNPSGNASNSSGGACGVCPSPGNANATYPPARKATRRVPSPAHATPERRSPRVYNQGGLSGIEPLPEMDSYEYSGYAGGSPVRSGYHYPDFRESRGAFGEYTPPPNMSNSMGANQTFPGACPRRRASQSPSSRGNASMPNRSYSPSGMSSPGSQRSGGSRSCGQSSGQSCNASDNQQGSRRIIERSTSRSGNEQVNTTKITEEADDTAMFMAQMFNESVDELIMRQLECMVEVLKAHDYDINMAGGCSDSMEEQHDAVIADLNRVFTEEINNLVNDMLEAYMQAMEQNDGRLIRIEESSDVGPDGVTSYRTETYEEGGGNKGRMHLPPDDAPIGEFIMVILHNHFLDEKQLLEGCSGGSQQMIALADMNLKVKEEARLIIEIFKNKYRENMIEPTGSFTETFESSMSDGNLNTSEKKVTRMRHPNEVEIENLTKVLSTNAINHRDMRQLMETQHFYEQQCRGDTQDLRSKQHMEMTALDDQHIQEMVAISTQIRNLRQQMIAEGGVNPSNSVTETRITSQSDSSGCSSPGPGRFNPMAHSTPKKQGRRNATPTSPDQFRNANGNGSYFEPASTGENSGRAALNNSAGRRTPRMMESNLMNESPPMDMMGMSPPMHGCGNIMCESPPPNMAPPPNANMSYSSPPRNQSRGTPRNSGCGRGGGPTTSSPHNNAPGMSPMNLSPIGNKSMAAEGTFSLMNPRQLNFDVTQNEHIQSLSPDFNYPRRNRSANPPRQVDRTMPERPKPAQISGMRGPGCHCCNCERSSR